MYKETDKTYVYTSQRFNHTLMLSFHVIVRGVNSSGLWSTKGCDVDASASNETHSVCKCDHLTNFAVLMQVRLDSDLEVMELASYRCHMPEREYVTFLVLSLTGQNSCV